MNTDIGNTYYVTEYSIARYIISIVIFVSCVSLSHKFVYYVSTSLNIDTDQNESYQIPRIIKTCIRTLFIITGILISLKISNVDTTYFLSGLGILGVVIPLSVQAPIQDFMTGLMLATFNKVNIGDFIIIDKDISGEIVSVDAFSTYLKDPSTNLIIDIPNSKLWSLPTRSIYNSRNYKITLDILISHKNNIRTIEKIIKGKLRKQKKVTDVDINYSASDKRGLMLKILVSIDTNKSIPQLTRHLYKILKMELQDRNVIFVDGNFPVSVRYKSSTSHPIIIENTSYA